MVDPDAKLSVIRQAIVPGISRGSVCYKPRPVSDADMKLMHRIDKLHMEFPFAERDGKLGVQLDGPIGVGVSRLEVIEGPTGRRRRTKAERARIAAESLPLGRR